MTAETNNECQHKDGNDLRPVKKIKRSLMLYAYMPLSIIYMELLLRLLCGYPFSPGLGFALLFSASVGFAIHAISLIIGNPKVSRIVAGILLGILCFVFGFQYFMFSTYRVFMGFETIFFAMGQVVDEFASMLLSTIISGIPIIIAFFAPLILFLLLTSNRITYIGGRNKKRRIAIRSLLKWRIPYSAGEKKARIRCVSLLAYMLGIAILSQVVILNNSANEKAAYYLEYHLDSSSRRLGILMGLSLDVRYSIFGYPYEDAIFFMEEPPMGALPFISTEQSDVTQPHALSGYEEKESFKAPKADQSQLQEPIVYGYNILDIDFDTLISNEENSNIMAIHEYAASLSGSRQNEYTGIFEGKNLILITAEAFSKQAVDPVMTPTLYRLVHNGFYFSDFYQPTWGGSTSSGEYSILTGLAPVSGAMSIQQAATQNLSFTIGNKLTNRSYFSASYHNGSHTYYNRHRTHTNYGYSTFTAMGNGMEDHVAPEWPASDLEMMQFSLPHYIDNQPFSVYYMTISGHGLYSRGSNAMSDKNWDAFPEQYSEMSNTVRAYMASNLELEYALEFIVSSLEAAGIADDTVIALATDHYPYCLEKSEAWGNDRDFLGELYGFSVQTPADRDLSALIIWSGSLENEHKELAKEISSPAFSLDILPTLCNLFGVEYDSRLLVGRDVFSDDDALVFWLDRSWKTDLGFFHASTGEFIPTHEIEVPDEYIERVRTIVNNRINFSGAVITFDYFNILFT